MIIAITEDILNKIRGSLNIIGASMEYNDIIKAKHVFKEISEKVKETGIFETYAKEYQTFLENFYKDRSKEEKVVNAWVYFLKISSSAKDSDDLCETIIFGIPILNDLIEESIGYLN